MAPPKKYSDQLRADAVARWRSMDPRPPIAHLAREMGIHPEALRTWIRADETERGERPERLSRADAEDLVRLRRENAHLRWLVEVLTAAGAVFAAEVLRTREAVED
ncbi:transposase [Streptomyces sp. NPDC001985]|uniref:transposase n=1 Tax=Streptomyces sp. NPDC001985 TaxID=3154406 RepID=UPI0033212032